MGVKNAITMTSPVTLPSILGLSVEPSLHDGNVYHGSGRGSTAVPVQRYNTVCDAEPLIDHPGNAL